MHVNAKKTATAGVLAAFTVLLVVLSSVIETNSLFLIAAASFCVGIAVREWGVCTGAVFLAASFFLNLFIAPNKMYCMTFAAMGLYILLSEFLWKKVAEAKKIKRRKTILWLGKYIVFNCIYIPVIVLFPELIFAKKIAESILWVLFLAGQAGIFVFDQAYMYFQAYVWGKLRNKLIEK